MRQRRFGELLARRSPILCDALVIHSARLRIHLKDVKDPLFQVPYEEPGIEHAWHLYVLRLHPERLRIGRAQFVELLRERGIGTSVHCIPLHTMHFYQERYGYRTGDFPIAEDVYSRCLSLPIYPAMSDEDVAYVIETVLALARENRR